MDMIREGIVSAVYPERCSARVAFSDRDDLVSAELAILVPATLRNKYYALPDVGDSVVCIFSPNDDHGNGFIIGSRYDDKNPPPSDSQDISMIHFDDGTNISYNRSSHELVINCVGNIKINGKRIDLN